MGQVTGAGYTIASVLIVALASSTSSAGEHPGSFSRAKTLLSNFYSTKIEAETFYCGCSFVGSDIDAGTCGYVARKQPERGKRVEWEHVVPAWEVGHQRQCWQVGGRQKCRSTDPYFVMMTSDLHNLKPAVGELNGDRSNYRFGMVPGEPRAYGACNFEVNFKDRRAEPPDDRQGDVARVYFYMRDRYGLRISSQQTKLFEAWARMDPVDQHERKLNEAVATIQGNSNCYVSQDCEIERAFDPRDAKAAASAFACNADIRYCKHMESCAQAKYYLNQCDRSRLDGDGDGVPCEALCR